ncbi:MAG: DUF4012 domain-containing protein [Chloroflexi bacterium]|nr:DUF4012 domain-containing protein [Chloroflexota bacterium]
MKTPIRWKRLILGFILIVLLIWLGLLAYVGLTLRADVLALQDIAANLPGPLEPAQIDLAQIQSHVTSIHQNLTSLRSLASPLLAITPALGWLPEVGGDVRAAPALLDMTLEFTDLSERALRMLAPFWPPPGTDGRFSLPMLTRVLQILQPAMTSFAANVDRAGTRRQTIDTPSLSPRLRSIIDRFDAAYPLLTDGLSLARIAPQLLGADRPRTYLIILQNEDELRPTGGFISAAGQVTLDAGQIVTLTVNDAYQADDLTQPYGATPQPMVDYMRMHLWLFRDSNWSPDFPTAARKAIELYTYTQGGDFDGVIALNQNVVEALTVGLGSLTIDAAQPPLTAQTIRAYMRNAWAPSGQADVGAWYNQRKDFIGRVMQAMLDRVLNQTGDINWGELSRALNGVLNSHDLLIMLTDPVLNEPLRETSWDGSLPDVSGDFLMIVDTNMGYNKANALIREAITYTVSLNPDDTATSDLVIGYTHFGSAASGCPHVVTAYTLSTTYDLLAQQCYWNYRRVLVPIGSTLIEATRHPTKLGELITGSTSDGATSVLSDTGKVAFGTFLIVGRGQSIESEVRYALPVGIIQQANDQHVYQLHVQKQPGTGHWPLTINVQWPASYQYVDAKPKPSRRSEHGAMFQLTLEADVDLSVILR